MPPMLAFVSSLFFPSIEIGQQVVLDKIPLLIEFLYLAIAVWSILFSHKVGRLLGQIMLFLYCFVLVIPAVITLNETYRLAVNVFFLPIPNISHYGVYSLFMYALLTICIFGIYAPHKAYLVWIEARLDEATNWVKDIVRRKYIITGMVTTVLLLLLLCLFGEKIPRINLFVTVLRQTTIFLTILTLFIFYIPARFRHGFLVLMIGLTILALKYHSAYSWNGLILIAVLTPRFSWNGFLEFLHRVTEWGRAFVEQKPVLASFLSVFVICLLWYWPSWRSYFEGDEWVYFRGFHEAVQSPVWFIEGLLSTFNLSQHILHAAPITSMLFVIQYHLFQLNFHWYLLQSLITHVAVALSVGWFMYEFTYSKKWGYLSAVLFAAASSGVQAVTWILTALHTQNALLFGFVGLSLLLRSLRLKTPGRTGIWAYALLVCALFSKETALMFVGLYLFFVLKTVRKTDIQKIRFHVFGFSVMSVLFAITQFGFRQNSGSALTIPPAMEYLFHLITLSLKAFAQTVFTSPIPLRITEWITAMQFPYFNQEQSVRGTNYLMFTQIAGTEFVSYILGLILIGIVYFIVRERVYRKHAILGVVMFILGAIPISFISLRFPWWKYQAVVDSRHLYSLMPSMVIFVIIGLVRLELWSKTHHKIWLRLLPAMVFVALLASQFLLVRDFIVSQQKDIFLPERKTVVHVMQKTILKPPKKMVIFTQSDRTFYGFAQLLLPFQTAFSQVLPVIFDKTNHPGGHPYPPSFFKPDFIGNAGLASEGYEEEDGYGLGYFLSFNELIKTIERYRLPVNAVYAFSFESEKGIVSDISQNIREKITKKLASRKIFNNWTRYGSKKDKFSFQVNPKWRVTKDEDTYKITSPNGPIADITVLPPPTNTQFANYISDLVVEDSTPIGADFVLFARDVDLDGTRNFVTLNNYSDRTYTVAGNNDMFYRLLIYDKDTTDLIIRTMEFMDSDTDPISLPE